MVEGMRDTYVVVYALSTLVTIVVAGYCWRERRAIPVAPGLAAVLAVGAWWCACDVVVTAGAGTPLGRAALHAWMLALALTSPAYAYLVGLLLAPGRRPSPLAMTSVLAFTGLVVTLLVLPGTRTLFVRSAGPAVGPLQPWQKGELFWALAAADLLAALALWSLSARRLRRATPTRRRQLMAVLVSVLLVVAGAAAGLVPFLRSEPVTSAYFDYSALGWAAASVIFLWWLLTSGALAPSHPVRSAVFDELDDAVVVLDSTGRVVEMNRAARAVVGEDRLHERGAQAVLARLGLGDQEGWDATDVDVQVSVSPLRSHGDDLGTLLVLRDVTDHARARAALLESNLSLRDELDALQLLGRDVADAALVDAVTGLPNRRHLADVLDAVVSDALESVPPAPCAVVRVEVDGLDVVARERGTAVRDDVLRHVADVLRDVRPPRGIVTRVGAAGFAVVLPGASGADAQACSDAAEAVLAVRPVRGALVSVQIGWAALTEPVEPHVLLTRADEAVRPARRRRPR